MTRTRRWLWPTLATLLVATRVATCAEPVVFQAWRCAERGGANALYCYLRVHQRDCDYSQLAEQLTSQGKSEHDATELIRAALDYGLRLELRSLTFEELTALPPPILTYVDGTRPGYGAFVLVQEVTSRQVLLMNGPTATVHKVDQDEFRRSWSGCVLLPASRSSSNVTSGALGFSTALLLFVGCGRRLLSRRPAIRAP